MNTTTVYAVEYRIAGADGTSDWYPSGEHRCPDFDAALTAAARMHAEADPGVGFATRIIEVVSTVVEGSFHCSR